jgi:hypothetical protein
LRQGGLAFSRGARVELLHRARLVLPLCVLGGAPPPRRLRQWGGGRRLKRFPPIFQPPPPTAAPNRRPQPPPPTAANRRPHPPPPTAVPSPHRGRRQGRLHAAGQARHPRGPGRDGRWAGAGVGGRSFRRPAPRGAAKHHPRAREASPRPQPQPPTPPFPPATVFFYPSSYQTIADRIRAAYTGPSKLNLALFFNGGMIAGVINRGPDPVKKPDKLSRGGAGGGDALSSVWGPLKPLAEWPDGGAIAAGAGAMRGLLESMNVLGTVRGGPLLGAPSWGTVLVGCFGGRLLLFVSFGVRPAGCTGLESGTLQGAPPGAADDDDTLKKERETPRKPRRRCRAATRAPPSRPSPTSSRAASEKWTRSCPRWGSTSRPGRPNPASGS